MSSEPDTNECRTASLRPCDMADCCRTNVSSEDAALDDLIRRALEAGIKRDALRYAEWRAEVERRPAQGLPGELV